MFEDVEEALARDTATRRRFCGFGQWVRTLSDEDRARAEELVDDERYNCRQLARYFSSKGAKFNDQVINRHRNSRCCGRTRGGDRDEP